MKTYSLIFDIRYFALATFPEAWTAFIMRFLTCADSDADTAVGCDGEDGDEGDEEPNGLRPPKDIVGLWLESWDSADSESPLYCVAPIFSKGFEWSQRGTGSRKF